MIPILFEKTATTYTTNGIGRLSDAISCDVTEVRNGEYTLEMEYPMTGMYFDRLAEEMIIVAKPFDGGDNQPFSIYKISKPIDGIVTVYAQHISYLLNKMVVMPYTADTCQEALSLIPSNVVGGTTFTFWTDKSVTASFKNEEPRGARGLLGGEQNSILDIFGKGEYEFDKFIVRLHVNRGSDNGVTLRYGKNITELENTLDMSNVYTGIVPFWKTNDEIVTLPEKVIWSSYTGLYAHYLAKVVDFTSEWQDKPTVAQLRTRAQKYLTDNEGWTLKQNVTVSFVNLADTEEYKDIAPLERVKLCDTITIIDTPLGVNVKAEVVKTIYDSLLERYKEIEIGETRPNLKTVIEDQIKEPIMAQTSTRMQAAIKYATDLITGGKGGYLIINTNDDGTPNELLIMNTPDKKTATKVLRINMNGIGFGKSYEGPFDTAWTLDGVFVANYIQTGTLKADLIRTGLLRAANNSNNFWNMLTGEFHMRSNGSTQGIDFVNGVLAINASNITTGSMSADRITAGTLDASKVNVTNLNASNITAGTLTADRVRAGTLTDGHGNTWNMSNGGMSMNGSFTSTSGNTSSQIANGELVLRTGGNVIARLGNDSGTGSARLYMPGFSVDSALFDCGKVTSFFNTVKFYNNVLNSGGGVQFVSDRNKKNTILDIAKDAALKFIMRLRPRSFKFNNGTSDRKHHGFIAQEVLEAMNGDDWGVYTEWKDDKEKTCGLRYDEIIADLVAVVQAQQKQINGLEGRIAALEGKG